VPGDKSISHRSLILACLAEGESRVAGILDSEDVKSTAGALRALGANIPELSGEMLIGGLGLRGLRQPKHALDCGNSGTTTRLLAGVVAGHPFAARFEGDPSLSRRPMKRIAEPLTYMGAQFDFERGDGLPMTVHGVDLRSIDWDTKSASAQVKSAILLAGLVSEVRPARRLTPLDLAVPADPSSAAFFVALASLAASGELQLDDVCLNPTRIGFISAIKRMGGDIRVTARATEGGEETGTLNVHPARLGNLRITAADVPSLIDELPLLACVAAAAGVELEITGASELRVKESDRISVVVRNLRAIGAKAEELPDGLRVLPGGREFSGTVDPRGDHRIAMAFGILSAVSGNRIEITNPDVVAVSYPRFWEDLRRVAE
jgi:3-phosphoshikimate 1-carboxyvinyltransferase